MELKDKNHLPVFDPATSDVANKIVLITGSSDGIGKATALEFAKHGANIVVTYCSNKKRGEEVFRECNKIKESLLLQLDVTNNESVKNCIEKTIDKFGAIDILVNNAGVVIEKNFAEESNKEIDFQIDTNLLGLIKMTKSVLPYMQGQNSGIIINIASQIGKKVEWKDLSVYCATKFAVRGFTQALAKELPEGIKIFCVNPGMTATKITGFKGVEPKKVAEVILKTATGEIKPDENFDVDVWNYV